MSDNNKRYNLENYTIGKGIQVARANLGGWSQGQLAIKVGCKNKDVVNMENRQHPRLMELLEWCNKLDCDIDFLLGFQEHQHKDNTDIGAVTGLDAHTIDMLKKEKIHPPAVKIRSKKDEDKSAVISGIKTADIFNGLVYRNGIDLTRSIHQYVREKMVGSLLDKSVDNIIRHHRLQTGRIASSQSVLDFANSVLTNARMMTSLSSLTLTGRMQTGIDDDFTYFCEKMIPEGYNKTECRIIFDCMQSKSRTDALRMKCFDLLMKFLDGMAEDGQLKYHSAVMSGDYDLTSTKIYEESIEDLEEGNHTMMAFAQKKEMTRLKTEVLDVTDERNKLIEDNSKISAELSEAKWKIKSLEEELDRIKAEAEAKE